MGVYCACPLSCEKLPSRMVVMISLRTLFLAVLLLSSGLLPAQAQSTAPAAREYRVLLVGNSFTYANNLPALLRAVGASQNTPIITETYAAPGGTLIERWKDGHAADALRNRKFDAVVLQEMGGQVGCMVSASQSRTAPCAASQRAHESFAKLANEQSTKPLLFTDWSDDKRTQGRIRGGMRMLSKETGATIFDAAGAIAAMQQAIPGTSPYPDGMHPSTQASLMLAVTLYRDITGNTPVARDLRVTATLLPANAAVSPASPMESQPALAGDGKTTIVPAALIEPLIKALPDPKDSGEVNPSRSRR